MTFSALMIVAEAVSALCLSVDPLPPPAPAYDSVLAPIMIEGNPVELEVFRATVDPGDPMLPCVPWYDVSEGDAPTPGFQTVWASFEAKGPTAYLTTRLTRGDAPEAILAVFDNGGGLMTRLGCSSHPTLADTELSSLCVDGLTLGQTYLVEVAMPYAVQVRASVMLEVIEPCPGWKVAPCYAPNGTCSVRSVWSCAEVEGFWHENGPACYVGFCEEWAPNDVHNTAVPLGSGPTIVQDANVCASDDFQTAWFGLQDLVNRGIWYRAVGNGQRLRVTACSEYGEFDPAVIVMCGNGDSPDLMRFGPSNDTCGVDGRAAVAEWCPALGVEYLVLVGGMGRDSQYGSLTITLEAVAPCATADWCCRVDVNQGGTVDLEDLLSLFDWWTAGLPIADFNRNGTVDLADLLDFFDAWTAGC